MERNILSVHFKGIDAAAKASIVDITSSPLFAWSNLNHFRYDKNIEPPFLPSLEPNMAVSGDWEEFPDDIGETITGMWAKEMSDVNGVYAVPPTLQFSFSLLHRSSGFTFYLYGDCGYTVRVTWYSDIEGTDTIRTEIHELELNYDHEGRKIGILMDTQRNWRNVKFEFIKSSIPFRFVRVWDIMYGHMRIFNDVEISGCRLREAIDPTVETITINTASIKIRSRHSVFSPITSPDFDGLMMKYQPFSIYRNKDLFGVFFLDKWTDPHQVGIEFDLLGIDAMGILDMYEFRGDMYENEPVRNILDEIFGICFPTRIITYLLDPELEDELISGHIPFGTCGIAFQHIMFALNATADTSRTDYIWIYPMEVQVLVDVTPRSDDKQPFVEMSDLKSLLPPFYYSTNEPNYEIGDERLEEMPDTKGELNFGWCSESMCDENGMFKPDEAIVYLDFETNHFFESMTFTCGAYENEYIKRLKVTWLDEFERIIHEQIFTFESNIITITATVSKYRYIILNVLEMSQPHRFAKLYHEYYGLSFYIPLNEQYPSGRDEPTDWVSGVSVVSHSYIKGDEEPREVFKDLLPLGVSNPILFSEPVYDLSISPNAIFIDYNANYCIIEVTSTQDEVVITGMPYIHNKRLHEIYADMEAGQIENIVPYENYTLVSPDRGDHIAQKIYEYLKFPIESTKDILLMNREVGYFAQRETRGKPTIALITNLDINLRAANKGRSTATARFKGFVK